MPKLRPLPVRKVVKILKDNGFELARTKRHHVYKRRNGEDVLTTLVPRPHKRDIVVSVIKAIIMQTRKSREEFY